MNERSPAAGWALTVVLRVVLLIAVFAQLVFLASRYRYRQDITSDKLYTLTSSTQRVLDSLSDRLLLECYFTRDDKLPRSMQDARRDMRGVFDEYVRRSNGKVDVQFFDPQSDTVIRQKAERLQMQPQQVETVEFGDLRQLPIWQGVRVRYGGDKQEVVPILPFYASTFQYEAVLTPLIKNVAVKAKPKVKVWSQPAQNQTRGVPKGWTHIRELLKNSFDFSDLDLSDGKLVPDDTRILLVFRPHDLTDRHKYAFDQYLMRGGKVVVFADTTDVDVGNADFRSFYPMPVEYDAKDAALKFLDQLAHYGVAVEDKVVADVANNTNETFKRVVQSGLGQGYMPYPYPYAVRALAVDWGADEVAKQLARGDQERQAQYKQTFKLGLNPEHPLTLKQQRGPTLFWPCPVSLAAKLPEGVKGETIFRTSPVCLVEKLAGDLNMFGQGVTNIDDLNAAVNRFWTTVKSKVEAEPRRQAGLCVALEGSFPSFFVGKAVPPKRPKVDAKPETDPLKEKVGKEGEKPTEPTKDEKDGADQVGPKPAGQDADDAKDRDPPLLEKAAAGAQLVVVGDADFLRDDMVGGAYAQPGKAGFVGPVSDNLSLLFLNVLLDWLVQDTDLVALRTKAATDRTMRLAQQDTFNNESVEAFTQRVQRKEAMLQWVNVLAPAGLLMVVWLFAVIRRSQRKAAFLRALGN